MRAKKFAKNLVSKLILQIITIVYGFIVPKIIINTFGSSVNGLISSITQFLAYITLLESGFGPVVKAALYKPLANRNKKEITNILRASERFFRVIAFIFIIYIIILAFIYPFIINQQFNYWFTFSLIFIIGISTFAEYFFGMTYKLFIHSDQKEYVISIIEIITYILNVVLIIITVKIFPNIHIIKLISALIFVLRPILQNVYVKKKYKIDLKEADKKYELKNKWYSLSQHIAYVIHNNTDITVLTFFSELAEISVYSVYYLVVKGIKSLMQAFSSGIDALFGNMIAKNEKENLKLKFSVYETFYFTIATIAYSCTMILIVPFISVYTKGITDVNYIRYAFGYLLVISEYIFTIRVPYNSIIMASGHFKETRKGAWFESITNIVVSLILVFKLGLVGVAIGTAAAMSVRTIDFVHYANKNILKQSVWTSVKKIMILIFETFVVVLICNNIPMFVNDSYHNWIINSLIVLIITSTIVIITNILFYREEFKEIKRIVGRSFNKKNNINTSEEK